MRYCPTEEMIADYFTKPLQGSSFRKMRNSIMNINPSINYNYAIGLQECVETNRWQDKVVRW